MHLGNHTATVLRPPENDPFGDPSAGVPAETEVSGTSMQPSSSAETTGERDTVITEWTWFVPPGTDVRATDKVRWRGALFDVQGDPQPWDDHQGRPHHMEIQLRRVTG